MPDVVRTLNRSFRRVLRPKMCNPNHKNKQKETVMSKTLSFELKNDETGTNGNMDIQFLQDHSGQVVIPDIDEKLSCGIAVLVLVMGLVFIAGLIASFFCDRIHTVYMLIGCASTMVVSVLFLWLYCRYRVHMARLITAERKQGYEVLKEIAKRQPEANQTYMFMAKSSRLLGKISEKMSKMDQMHMAIEKSNGYIQKLIQRLSAN